MQQDVRVGPPALLDDYRPHPGVYDECVDERGQLRPHWRPFVERFAALAPPARNDLERLVRRRLQAAGVAFNVYAQPDDERASWDLDLWPTILSVDDWAALERAVVQRVRLLEATLTDLYGRQGLLRQKVLPPALVFGNRDFLYPCSQWQDLPVPFLVNYACDVARDADGRWVVLADQVDAPTGQGWVLASRLALGQAMGPLFLEAGVRRLTAHLNRLGEALRAGGEEAGQTVLLSRGPEDPSYFSHAFLARSLGLPVVEAADLTQRGGRIFLKTLEGLQPVGVVFRKRAARELDPLHLPGFGGRGTAGLVDAARLGNVRVINALGTGVLQSRTIGPFAERLCRHLLDADPLIADAPVRWLGDPDQRTATLQDPSWSLSPMTARHDPGARGAAELDNDGSPAVTQLLAREGHGWVAEQPVTLGTVPCWRGGRLEPVPWAMRLFACVSADGVHLLPAALGRLSSTAASAGLPSGAGSKDVWIAAPPDQPPLAALLSQRMASTTLQRGERDLLSGTAEALFWLGRYTERMDSTLRMLRAVLARLLEAGTAAETAQLLLHLVRLHLDEEPEGDTTLARLGHAVATLLHAEDCVDGLAGCLQGIQRNAILARGVLSLDSWNALNALRTDGRWRQSWRSALSQPPVELVDDALRMLVAFSGTAAEHMTRNDAWRFLDLGKRLERALQVAELVSRGLRTPPGVDRDGALSALLEIGDSYMTYRARYASLPMAVPVVDLLLLDETNPRGLVFQVERLEATLAELPHEGPYRSPAQRSVLGLLTRLRKLDARDLVNDEGKAEPLATEAQAVRTALEAASDQLGRAYFLLAETPTTTLSARRASAP
ncbi:MAG: circularly permuted type 2 ATP-grasp protein [Pseudomonadota bacterium]